MGADVVAILREARRMMTKLTLAALALLTAAGCGSIREPRPDTNSIGCYNVEAHAAGAFASGSTEGCFCETTKGHEYTVDGRLTFDLDNCSVTIEKGDE